MVIRQTTLEGIEVRGHRPMELCLSAVRREFRRIAIHAVAMRYDDTEATYAFTVDGAQSARTIRHITLYLKGAVEMWRLLSY